MSEKEYTALVHRLFDGLNRRNLDVIDECCTADYISHDNPPRPDSIGPAQSKSFMEAFFTAYPDAHFTIEEILVSGDTTAVRWHYEATHTGATPAMKIAPTGKKVYLMACSVYHLKDGKIAEEWMYTDQTALLEQLGVLPAA